MAGEPQLTEEQRADVRTKLLAIRDELSPPVGNKAAWQTVADVLNKGASDPKERTTGETLRKMGEDGTGGQKVARLVRRYLGLDVREQTREYDLRYPTKRTAAALLKNIVDDEAIELMLNEEHVGSEGDPGEEFWIESAKRWHRRRTKLRADVKAMPPELAEELPMTGRPKKGKKR